MTGAFSGKVCNRLLPAATPFAVLLLCAAGLAAQSPFQFREASLLESRMMPNPGGFTDLTHFEENMNHVTPTWIQMGDCMVPGCMDPSGKTVLDLDNLFLYQSDRWTNLLVQTDKARGEGAFAVAGPVYQRMIDMLKKARGENSSAVALMLDHVGEYDLEARNFDKAYQDFQDAIAVRRVMLKTLPQGNAGVPNDPNAMNRLEATMHLADLLTRAGQMELGKGDLAHAEQHLAEAVSICNQKTNIQFVGSIYAVYFYSLVLERENKWKQAEELWQQSVQLREALPQNIVYWDSQKEMAAFYARHGDFHAAAQIAQKVEDGEKNQQVQPPQRMPYLIDSRPLRDRSGKFHYRYTAESEAGLKEILAMDKWQTDGSAAASALLPELFDSGSRPLLDGGSDSERAQLVAWFEHRVFLHLSILLDGQPAQEQVDKAFELVSGVQGRYLSAIADATAIAESGRNNPGVDTDAIPIIDQMGEARDSQAGVYLASALDGKPFRTADFGAAENEQRILSFMLSGDPSNEYHSYFSLKGVAQAVPADAAFLDVVSWERSDRAGKAAPVREYGVFVLRGGQPVHYYRIGAAAAIDEDIDGLKTGVLGNRTRGFLVESTGKTAGPDVVEAKLKDLYARVIAPLGSDLDGVEQLLIVPDGRLTLAPMSAFMGPDGHALLEKHTITYMSSWRDIYTTVAWGSDASSQPVIIANPDFNFDIGAPAAAASTAKRPVFTPLPGAEQEAKDVADALHVPADRVLIGSASRKWLVQSLESPGVLHFATHTVPSLDWKLPIADYNLFDVPQVNTSQNPLIQSFIALAGANHEQSGPEDGILTGLEVSRLHLNGTKLVVLSTCESGQGTPVEGLGVMGLRAAFAMAGAQSLVMTLWPVDDAAGRQFMQFFYAHLSQGPASAVRLAQLDMMHTEQYKNPFYWSGYVVSGGLEAHGAKARPTANAAAQKPRTETLITPRCFEIFMSAHHDVETYYETFRLKIGGVVYKNEDSAGQVTYDLSNPGNTIAERDTTSLNNGPRQMYEVKGEGRDRWTSSITMQRGNGSSEMDLRFGRRSTDVDKRQVIVMKGGTGAFPTLDIPEKFPALSSLTEASDSYEKEAKIDRIAACSTMPSW